MFEELGEVLGVAIGAGAVPLKFEVTDVAASTGAATGGVHLVTGTARYRDATVPWRLVVKRLRRPAPATARGGLDPHHFRYWERESFAYRSGLLPSGEGLRAPRCLGVYPDPGGVRLWLPAVADDGPDWDIARYELAARQLGAWQRAAGLPVLEWLAGDQLRQRVEATDATGGLAEPAGFGPRLAAVWRQRYEMLDALDRLPRVLCHGDFHRGNLLATGTGGTWVVDWGALGTGFPGYDLAHLALGAPPGIQRYLHPAADGPLVEAYLAGLGGTVTAEQARRGFTGGYVLTAVSRISWRLGREPAPAEVAAVAQLADWALAAAG